MPMVPTIKIPAIKATIQRNEPTNGATNLPWKFVPRDASMINEPTWHCHGIVRSSDPNIPSNVSWFAHCDWASHRSLLSKVRRVHRSADGAIQADENSKFQNRD